MEQTKQEEGQHTSKRVRTRPLCVGMLSAACILLAALIAVAVYVSRHYRGAQESMAGYIEAEKNNLLLRNTSDYLTDQARGYAATMDFQFVENYYEEINGTQRREKALNAVKAMYPNTPACTFMTTAYHYSNELVRQESYAMRLIAEASGEPEENWPADLRAVRLRAADQLLSPDEKGDTAIELVYGDSYTITKNQILQNLDYSLDELYYAMRDTMQADDRALGRAMWGQGALFFLLFLETACAVLLIGALAVRPVKVYLSYLQKEKCVKAGGVFEMERLTLQYEDVQELSDAAKLMSGEQDSRDPLTGLMNRRAFDHMKKMLSGQQDPVGVVFLKIDHLRSVNEGSGYEAGDRLLQRVANLLTEHFRATDTIAYFGGNEFALILPGIREQQQKLVVQKVDSINKSLQRPQDGLPPASLSAGAAFSHAGLTGDLCQKASAALQERRENGHSGCGVYAGAEN